TDFEDAVPRGFSHHPIAFFAFAKRLLGLQALGNIDGDSSDHNGPRLAVKYGKLADHRVMNAVRLRERLNSLQAFAGRERDAVVLLELPGCLRGKYFVVSLATQF